MLRIPYDLEQYFSHQDLQSIIDALSQHEIVCLPTKNGYRLIANGCSAKAMDKLRVMRELDQTHPFTIIVDSVKSFGDWCDITTEQFRLLKRTSTAGHTYLVTANKKLPKAITALRADKKVVGLRIADSQSILLEVIANFGPESLALISSATRPPGEAYVLSSCDEIEQQWPHDIRLIVDAGIIAHNEASIIDLQSGGTGLLR